jgi:hypothetical protein
VTIHGVTDGSILPSRHRSVTVCRWLKLDYSGSSRTQKVSKSLKINNFIEFWKFNDWCEICKNVDYEPRGSGFNSCQPHQTNNPEAEMLQGFFISGHKSDRD